MEEKETFYRIYSLDANTYERPNLFGSNPSGLFTYDGAVEYLDRLVWTVRRGAPHVDEQRLRSRFQIRPYAVLPEAYTEKGEVLHGS